MKTANFIKVAAMAGVLSLGLSTAYAGSAATVGHDFFSPKAPTAFKGSMYKNDTFVNLSHQGLTIYAPGASTQLAGVSTSQNSIHLYNQYNGGTTPVTIDGPYGNPIQLPSGQSFENVYVPAYADIAIMNENGTLVGAIAYGK